jgi:hypothetical protein
MLVLDIDVHLDVCSRGFNLTRLSGASTADHFRRGVLISSCAAVSSLYHMLRLTVQAPSTKLSETDIKLGETCRHTGKA